MNTQPQQHGDLARPAFRLATCPRHPRNRWWCRKCQRQVALSYEKVYDAFWRSNQRYNELADRLEASWETPAHDWRAESSGLAYMICQIHDDYIFAKEGLGGDSEFLANAIFNAYRWVDGPFRTYFDGSSGPGGVRTSPTVTPDPEAHIDESRGCR